MRYWDDSMRPLYTLPEPEGKRVQLEFYSILLSDILSHKVGGFADHVNAQIVHADDACIRLEVGHRNALPSEEFAVEITLCLEREPSKLANNVKVELRPLGWAPSGRKRQARYEELTRVLHSYLMPHSVSDVPVSAA